MTEPWDELRKRGRGRPDLSCEALLDEVGRLRRRRKNCQSLDRGMERRTK